MPNAMKQVLRRLRARKPIRRRGRFQLRPIDALETRILPTAVVAFTGTAMTITGDTGPNLISVVRNGAQVHVDGNGGLITVAGSNVTDFDFPLNGAFNLTATFQNDSDILVVGDVGLGLQLKSVNVKMGDGLSDIFTITDCTLSGKLTVTTGDGFDVVTVAATSVTGTTVINTGWSDDVVTLIGGTFTGATTINTDIGNDIALITGIGPARAKFVGKLTVTTGDDADVVALSVLDTKAVSVDTGDGTDVVGITDILINGGLSVKTGSDVDVLGMALIVQSGTGANLFDVGSGTDIVGIQASSLSGATTVNMGSGIAQLLSIEDVGFNGTFTYNSQGTVDVIAIEQDTAQAGATTFAKAAKFNFGILSTVLLSAGDPNTTTSFLSTVSFTGRSLITTITTDLTVSFAVAPVLKNVVIV